MGITVKPGFIPAIGTPLDEEGYLVEDSIRAETERMIEAGCSAILCMGSMGQQAFIRMAETRKTAAAVVDQAAGRVPVFVGAMDCSIQRARERFELMEDIPLDAFVLTTPYYEACTREEILNYYKRVAAYTAHNIILYDLPGVTQSKITYDIVVELVKTVPNLAGIKSNDMYMLRKLKVCGEVPDDFLCCFSGMDVFDIGFKWGLTNYLDGMPSCTPYNFSMLDRSMKAGDYTAAAKYLTNILDLRDFFLANNLWPCFTAAMNMLGFAGNFAPDYCTGITEETVEAVRREMKRIGEL